MNWNKKSHHYNYCSAASIVHTQSYGLFNDACN